MISWMLSETPGKANQPNQSINTYVTSSTVLRPYHASLGYHRGFVDARKEGHSEEELVTLEGKRRGEEKTHVWSKGTAGTCRFATRIDYILRGPQAR